MFGGLKVAIDKEIEHCFDIAIREAQKSDDLIAEALTHTKKIALSGGKRIRGALLCQAYFGFGGKEKKKILKVAAAIELVHLFLLVHDDIIDCGNLRHGEETLHKMLEKKYQKNITAEQARHFGESIAIIGGGMLYAIANRIILEAGFSLQETTRALVQLQKIVATTIIGQSQDISIERKRNVSEKEVLAMYENKTARYTFEGPLYLGALLSGCDDKKILRSLSSYAVPLGIAFQIQDDILGIFGQEKKIGKSVASDIEEGKISLMVARAQKTATKEQIKKLNAILGKKKLIKKEITIFKDILISSGALGYAQDFARLYLNRGKAEIEKIIILPESKKFLSDLVVYLEGREV
ncbi:MAG: Geranylgeranyl pyrophosphate synthase [Candidatus Moranbacteria bacterium GW2011_GWE1_36_7]|nr:MAG: Geranylgeranyl pyrophosphate synthase [Candidatus Moranbacteria bacterium GW2011_GWD2_36_12]KKQ04724.1 MAG: Geranylgeranyl pyrophosphate synthase [Candidatus Moranbacteria bacterium GW2011_GWE2_36_40]KKQ14343.1 MAG: Geranylgeranyl pyrophosphate synthase [Candidatus Moranbacteria bacterium GW2011_GWE1_36_7]